MAQNTPPKGITPLQVPEGIIPFKNGVPPGIVPFKYDGDSSALKNFMVGIGQGLTNEGGTASVANVWESWMPSWLTGRIGAVNPKTGEREVLQSTPSALGITDEEWDKLSSEERRVRVSKESAKRATKNINDEALSYSVGRFIGFGLDPSNLLIPAPAKMAGKMASGATVGAVDMAAYTASQEGKVDPAMVGVGAVIGGLAPPAIKGVAAGAKGIAKGSKKLVPQGIRHRQAEAKLLQIEKDLAELRLTSSNSVEAFLKLMQDRGGKYTAEEIEDAVVNSRRAMNAFPKRRDAKSFKALAQREAEGGFWNETGRIASKIIEPISTRFGRIDPKVKFDMRNMDRRTMQRVKDMDVKMEPFTRLMEDLHRTSLFGDKLNPFKFFTSGSNKIIHPFAGTERELEYRTLWKAILNASSNNSDAEVRRMVRARWGDKGIEAWKKYQAAQKEMAALKVKHEIIDADDVLNFYTPRWVKDYRLLRAKLGKDVTEYIDRVIAIKEKDLKRPLVEEELNDIYNKYLSGYYHRTKNAKFKNVIPSSKKRSIPIVTDEILDAYSPVYQSIHSDVRSTFDNIGRRELFGEAINKEFGDNVTDGITAYVNRVVAERGRMSQAQLDELGHLLTLRFVEGKKKPHKAMQAFKNYTYSALLGNPIAAITQFGDLAFSIYRYNVVNVVDGLWAALRGRGLTPKEMGMLENMAEEFVSTTGSKKFLDNLFKYSGFRMVDSLGKTAIMNGAIKKFARMTANPKKLQKLAAKWKDVLGEAEYKLLVKDLQELNKGFKRHLLTDRVKAVAFSELSDIQPTTLLEMPEMYLRMKNGKVVYMLRTFALKHLDFMRQEFLDELATTNPFKHPIKDAKLLAKGAYFASIFTMGGMTTDATKKFLTNKDMDVEEIWWDNILKNAPLVGDKYLLEKMRSTPDPVSRAMASLIAPATFYDKAARNAINVASHLSEGDFDTAMEDAMATSNLRYIPFIGRILEAWVDEF